MKCPSRSHSRNATVSSTSSDARTAAAVHGLRRHALDHPEHRREVADGELQVGERVAHRRDERLALLGRELPVELDSHHRLAAARLACVR